MLPPFWRGANMALDPHEIRIDTTTMSSPPPAPAANAPPQWMAGVLGLILTLVGMGAWMSIGPRMLAGGAASELEEQYQILVDSNASDMDLWARAGVVAECYLQAHDRERYAKWKSIAAKHARRAGIPGQ
jgi:hypothetical protein